MHDDGWFDLMGALLCTISKQERKNWEICRDVGLWGVPHGNKWKVNLTKAKTDDRLLFWIAAEGFVGWGTVTGPMRVPTSRDEVPWAGGLYRYAALVPMRVELELKKPLKLRFDESQKQLGTGISVFMLRRGFIHVRDEQADAAIAAMKRHANETKSDCA